MTRYIYPQNLKAMAKMWLWSLRAFAVLGICLLLSMVILVELKFLPPMAVTLCFGFLAIRPEDTTILEFIKYAVKYFISTQQYFEWRCA